MASANNIKLGVCTVTFKGVDLGHTIGGVTVTYTPEYKETSVDKFGKSIVEKFLVGERVKAKFSLAEWTLANLQKVIDQNTLQGDDSISVGSIAGKKATVNAGMLLLHPIENAASNLNDDFGIYKATIAGSELEIAYNNEGERVLPCEFDGMIDENRSDGNMLFFIGDSIG